MLRIFSKFQDYYDSAIGSFVDSDVVISRIPNAVHEKYSDIPDMKEFDGTWNCHRRNTYSNIDIHLLGFCGTWYYFIHDDGSSIAYKTFEEIIENNGKNSLFHWKSDSEYRDPNSDPYWKSLFEKYGPVLLIDKYQGQRYVPQWVKHQKLEIKVWPNLKEIQFQAVKDPYTALWELEHWFDSHARPDDAVVPVGDDITRLQAYGFDKKTSFRKPKEKDR